MSIFKEYTDIDIVFIHFLDISSLKALSIVNKYYKYKFSSILNQIQIFLAHEKEYILSIPEIPDKYTNLFIKSIIYSENIVIKYIYNTYYPNIHFYGEYPLQLMCKYSDAKLVEWFLSLDKFDIKIDDNLAYKYACSVKNIEVMRLLEKLI